jgi:hypothetical protein
MSYVLNFVLSRVNKNTNSKSADTVKLGDDFDKAQIGVKEPFSVTNFQFTS